MKRAEGWYTMSGSGGKNDWFTYVTKSGRWRSGGAPLDDCLAQKKRHPHYSMDMTPLTKTYIPKEYLEYANGS